MEHPLSQSEIDALMRSLLPANGEDIFQSKGTAVRTYDFKRPNKFNKDLMRTLLMVHDNFTRLLQTFFSAQLRTRVQVGVRNTNQYPYSEFVQLLPNPAVIATFSMEPLPGTCLVEFSQNIAYAIVDKVFGGPGADVQPQRSLSEIELSVIQRITTDMFHPLQEAWRNIAVVRPEFGAMETNPMFLQTSPPSEVLATITIGIQVGEHMGHLTLAFPYSTVQPVLARLSPHSWLSSDKPQDPHEAELVKNQVQESHIDVRVYLGNTRITVAEFMSLAVGDVIPLETRVTDETPIYIGNRLTYFGRPGTVRDRLSVQIRRQAPDPAGWPQP